MKDYGKVLDYNKAYGHIESQGNTYLALGKDIIDKNIKKGDEVEFEGEHIKTIEVGTVSLARFVKKRTLEKETK